MFDVFFRCGTLLFRSAEFVFDRGQFAREFQVRIVISATLPFATRAIILSHVIRHFAQRRAGEENLIDALALHQARIVVRDRSATAAEDRDVARALLFQLPNDFGKKIDVPAVVAGDADGRDIFLNRRAHDVADITMKAEINDFDPVPDEFEIDRIDRAVVSIADRDGGQNANR